MSSNSVMYSTVIGFILSTDNIVFMLDRYSEGLLSDARVIIKDKQERSTQVWVDITPNTCVILTRLVVNVVPILMAVNVVQYY